MIGLLCGAAMLGQSPAQQAPPPKVSSDDPFAGLSDKPATPLQAKRPARSWLRSLVTENLGFRKEVMSQFTGTEEGDMASRQSAGFEVLKKFSTGTATVASFNLQGRLVRRDGFNPVQNDMEGERRAGWAFEYHNVYLDLYNVLNPLLGSKRRGRQVGRFNIRAGRFYVPFGLNLQTDTHGPVLQLSNDRNFGFERDWYTGLWGSLNRHLNYDAYYLTGSGYDLAFKGQRGLGALRVSLSNRYSSKYGLEGGVSAMGGERLAMDRDRPRPMETRRAGVDARYRRAVPSGLLTLTTEFSGGEDARNAVAMQLHQAEYLRASRRWGVATQYRRFRETGAGVDASIIGEFTWYFRNDVGNSNLHWVTLNVERRLRRIQATPPRTIVTLQYYFYR
ncbi:MAG: hypothetical protein ACKV2U_04670 [Bryobacteraceae bacterium]